MKRVKVAARDNADERAMSTGVLSVEKTLQNGLSYRTWDESSAYLMSRDDVDEIVSAISSVVSMAREAADFLLDGEWGTFGMSNEIFELVRNSFDSRETEFFTRYDFAYTADGSLKLVGIEPDSPRYLVETAHTQRTWLFDMFGNKVKNHKVTQLNSIPEMILEAFKEFKNNDKNLHVFTSSLERGEDSISSSYIKGLARTCGLNVSGHRMKDLIWDKFSNVWVDEKGDEVTSFYKHYPWELIMSSPSSKNFIEHYEDFKQTLDPLWKIIMSNRAVLPAMYHLFPDSKILSPAKLDDVTGIGEDYVMSPVLLSSSRNEMGVLKGRAFTSWGENMKDLSNQPTIAYRKLDMPKRYRDASGGYRFTFLSVFTVGGSLAGIGVRESRLPLLGAHSTFKPHVVML